MSALAASSLANRVNDIHLREPLERLLHEHSSSAEIDAFVRKGLEFKRDSILSLVLRDYKIALSSEALQILLDQGAYCPPEIYESLDCCIGTIDEIIPLLVSKGIYPLNPSPVQLKAALKACCSVNTYEFLCQLGCQPDQEIFAYAGYCPTPSGVINDLLSKGLLPNEKVLLKFLLNLEEWEEDPDFFQAFTNFIATLPENVQTTTEMLHIAIDNGFSNVLLRALCSRGAKINHLTYVKFVIAQRDTDWMGQFLQDVQHAFISTSINELHRLNEDSIMSSAQGLDLHGVNEALLADTLKDDMPTTQMLNIALELNVSTRMIRWLIEQKGARPDYASKHKVIIRGESPDLLELISAYLPN